MTHLPAHRQLEGSTMLLAEPSEAPMLAPGREPAPSDPPSYSARIMNLPVRQFAQGETNEIAYKWGHRDARHAAAEIALEAEAEIARLRAELAAAVAAERERCAQVCEQEICTCCWDDDALAAAEHLAAEIRKLPAAPTTAAESKGTT